VSYTKQSETFSNKANYYNQNTQENDCDTSDSELSHFTEGQDGLIIIKQDQPNLKQNVK
jgi:hypothetical protein